MEIVLKVNVYLNEHQGLGTEGTPRILVDGGTGRRPDKMQSSVTIMPYMMASGEDKVVADAISEGLTHPGHDENPVIPQVRQSRSPITGLSKSKYIGGTGEQRFTLQQEGDQLTGAQAGEIYQSRLKGIVHTDRIELTSEMDVAGNSIFWTFRGVVSGSNASGTVHMGEYGDATWTAVMS